MFDLKKIQEKKEVISKRLASINPDVAHNDFGIYACSCSGGCEGSCEQSCSGRCYGCGKS